MNFSNFHIIIPPQDIELNPQCLEKIASGDKKEFEWLYKNYCSRLFDYLFLLSNDKHLSEDIVQDIFTKLWSHKEQLAEIKNFNGYIFYMAKNLLRDKWRKHQNEKEVLKNIASTGQPVEQNLFYHREEEKHLNATLKTLSPRQELIYRLIREEGQTREQVSKQLNISPNTVKATMQNALHKIKEQLKQTV